MGAASTPVPRIISIIKATLIKDVSAALLSMAAVNERLKSTGSYILSIEAIVKNRELTFFQSFVRFSFQEDRFSNCVVPCHQLIPLSFCWCWICLRWFRHQRRQFQKFNMMILDQTVCLSYLVLVSDPSDYFSYLSFEVLLIPENLFSDGSQNVLTFLVFQPNVGIRLF